MSVYLKHILRLLVVLCLPSVAVAQDLLGIKGEQGTSIGVYIKDIVTGEVLYDLNSEVALTPASVMKTLTSASALSLLGENYRFETPVVLRGELMQDTCWHGDLIVRASGDPTVESENFPSNLGFCDSIVASIIKLGVKQIDGAIMVDQPMSDAGPAVRWEIEDVGWPYGAGHFGFNYNDNTSVLEPLTGATNPYIPGLKVKVVDRSGSTELIRGIGSYDLTLYGKRPNSKKWTISTTMPDPAAVMTAALTEKLLAAGIGVGDVAITADGESEREIYCHHSPVVTEILRSLMVRSDNLFAEGMLRALAPEGDRDAAIDREKELWTGRGLDMECAIVFDGSGLTRGNRLQPRFVADLLEWMIQSPMADTYLSFFPRAGVDGTMKNFLAKSPLCGSIAMKTGSMNAVQSYAGYRLDESGAPTHIIVIMVNGFTCKRPELRAAVEDLLIETFL